MKKWIIISVIVVLVLGTSGILVRGKLLGKSGDNNPSDIPTTTVRRGDITVSIDATGTIEPLVIVEVRSKASGAITKLAVEEGDALNEGDLISEIEKTYTQANVDKSEADLTSSQARLTQAQMNIELQKKQSELQIRQARENVTEAETRVAKLQEDIKLEKEANARQVKEAENELEMAKLRLKQAQNSRPESLKRSEATVTQAKASLDLDQEEYNRKKALHEKKFVSQAEVDSAKAKLESAQAQYESALQQLEMVRVPSSVEELKLAELSVTKAELNLAAAEHRVKQEQSRERDLELSKSQLADAKSSLELTLANKAQISLREKDLEATQASVIRSQVALKEAQDKQADTIVKAPISGTILRRQVEEGQVITSSMGATAAAGTLLVTMADLENVYVKTEVDETDIGKVKPGQSVTITVDAFPDMTFDGTVLRIAPQGRAIQNVTTFEVTTEISNPSKILKPGMNASVEIHAVDIRDVLVVENEAIMDMRGRKMVIPVVDGEPTEQVEVTVGERGWDTTEIIFGLDEGEEVLVMTPGESGSGMPEWLRQRMGNPMSSFRRMQGGGPGRRGPR
jgi:RND family efflux transporter MFP subunit